MRRLGSGGESRGQDGSSARAFRGYCQSMHRRLILARHGHTEGNNGGNNTPLSGWHDMPLSPAGWRETELLAARLRDEYLRGAVIGSSPLQRCHRMAEAIATQIDGTIELNDDLREIFCGSVEGLAIGEAKTRYPELWTANLREESDDFRWPGGESYAEFRARCVGCMNVLRERHPSGPLVLVTHAGVISQLLGWLSGIASGRWAAYRPGNASLTELDDEGLVLSLKSFDDRRHLAGGLSLTSKGRSSADHPSPSMG
jgi:broad specificity phosphatase PhoE